MGKENQPQETYYSLKDPSRSHGRSGADRGAGKEHMSNNRDHRAALRAIRDVLAAHCACAPHDFLAGGLVITPAVEQAGRRRFPFPTKPLWVFSMGAGVVISCSPERMAWVRANLGSLDRDAI